MDNHEAKTFLECYSERKQLLLTETSLYEEFKFEMRRFLPLSELEDVFSDNNFWDMVINLIEIAEKQLNKQIVNA